MHHVQFVYRYGCIIYMQLHKMRTVIETSLLTSLYFTRIQPMHLITGVVSNSGMIYVIGGDDGSTNLDSVECYDPKSNTWTLLHLSMTTGRSYAGVAIVDKNC